MTEPTLREGEPSPRDVEIEASKAIPPIPALKPGARRKAIEKSIDYLLGFDGPIKHSEQHLLLFDLAGLLKSCLPLADRTNPDIGESLAPLAIHVVNRLWQAGVLHRELKWIDWSDSEAISLSFAKAWEDRKFSKGGDLLARAISFANEDVTELPGGQLSGRVFKAGWFLQKSQPNVPVILPVTEDVAEQLGLSLATLSAAFQRAVRIGLFLIQSPSSHHFRKARTFLVDLDHVAVSPLMEPKPETTKKPKKTKTS